MKKIITLLVSAVFLLGFASAAFAIHAEIPTGTQAVYSDEGTFLDVGGDMRVRGVWRGNHLDFNDALTRNDQRFFDQRYRLTFIVKTDNDIEARMRAVFGQNYVWGGDNAYSVDTGIDIIPDFLGLEFSDQSIAPSKNWVEWDWAYLHIPIFGYTVDVGRQRANWGLKFLGWDDPVDRIKILSHWGDVLIGVLYDKVVEETPVSFFGRPNFGFLSPWVQGSIKFHAPAIGKMGQDVDKYGALAVYGAEDFTVGILGLYFIDDSNIVDRFNACLGPGFPPVAASPTFPFPLANFCPGGPYSDTAFAVSAYGVFDIADKAVLTAEFAAKGGYLAGVSSSGSRDTQYGGFVGLNFPAGAWSIHGKAAFTKNGYVADNYWAPTVMVGTVNPTAMFDFGATGDTWMLQAGADYAITDATTIGGKVAYFNFSRYKCFTPDFPGFPGSLIIDFPPIPDPTCSSGGYADWEGTAVELDLQLRHRLSKNATYYIDLGWMRPEGITGFRGRGVTDDYAYSVGNKIEMTF